MFYREARFQLSCGTDYFEVQALLSTRWKGTLQYKLRSLLQFRYSGSQNFLELIDATPVVARFIGPLFDTDEF